MPVASAHSFVRENVKFASGKDFCAAWVYRPTATPLPLQGAVDAPAQTAKYPAMVLGHGLGGIKEMGLDRYAASFASLGIVCICFDYRYFGESGGEPRQLLDINSQLEDWSNAIDYTSRLEDVDNHRVGIFGSSFGGGHVITLAARDKRIKAVISQCPFTSGLHSSRTVGLLPLIKLGFWGLCDLFSRGNNIVPVALAGNPGDSESYGIKPSIAFTNRFTQTMPP